MVEQQHDLRVPTELVPRCPICGKPMSMNLRADASFVQDDGWDLACKRYQQWVESHQDKRIVYLELGVGGNTPGIIKYPFWQMVAQNPRGFYAQINFGEVIAPVQIEDRTMLVDADAAKVLAAVRACREA